MTSDVPTMMRGVTQHRYGGPEVLQVARVPVPDIQPDEVLIKVSGAGVDRGTWHLMTGLPRLLRLAFGLRRPRQSIPGLDVAGTVVAVGDNANRLSPGDEVFGIARGSLAEYAAAKESKISHRPGAVDADAAAVATVSGTTALQAVVDIGMIQADQDVLVMGGAGGVGSYALQIAKAHDAIVTGVSSTNKLEAMLALGADHVIDYTATDPLNGRLKYDLIIDTGGRRRTRDLRRALHPKGTVVIVGGEGGGDWTGGFGRMLRASILSPIVSQNLRPMASKEHHQQSDRLAQFMTDGVVTARIDRVYGLSQAADALRDLADGSIAGKPLVKVADG
jgi:NADPH:quinone reductase-like Zn-dependent oxidoreductase